jgi:hypothetical protein
VASRRRIVGSQRAGELAELLSECGAPDDALVTDRYIELKRFPGLARMVEDRTALPPPLPAWLSQEARHREVGDELEKKIAFRPYADGGATLPFASSSWQSPRRLHVELMRRADFFKEIAIRLGHPPDLAPIWVAEAAVAGRHSRAADTEAEDPVERHLRNVANHFQPGWDDWKDRDEPDFADHVEAIAQAYACLEEASEVPSIAAVHAVVLLADDHLVEGKRKPTLDYAPGAWAASFEEQMQREDVEQREGIKTCLMRGLCEEFGVEVTSEEVTIQAVSLGIEWELGNYVVLVAARLALGVDEFWRRVLAGRQDHEQEMITTVPLAARLTNVGRDDLGFWVDKEPRKLHPTTAARLALLAQAGSSR